MQPFGQLFPTGVEQNYFRDNFVEGAIMMGRTGKYLPVVSTEQKGTDTFYTYDKPVDVAYYLMEHPKVSLLTKYGWFVEDRQNMPIVCYMTYKNKKKSILKLQEGGILEISIKNDINNSNSYETRKFMVIYPVTDMELNMFVCQLVPYREKQAPVNPEPTKSDPLSENKWLDRKVVDITDEPTRYEEAQPIININSDRFLSR